VTRSQSRLRELCTGRPSSVRRVATLRCVAGDRSAGATIDGHSATVGKTPKRAASVPIPRAGPRRALSRLLGYCTEKRSLCNRRAAAWRLGAVAAVGLFAAAGCSLPRVEVGERIPYGPEPSEFGELTLPQREGKLPVVVMLHGGCWLSLFGLGLMDGLVTDLQAHGIAVWNIEYRRLGEAGGGYPGTYLDIGRAVDALRSIAKRYPLDLAKVVVVGHSAGGHLALWAAARARLPKDSPLAMSQPLPIASVVTLAGVDDLQAFRENGPIWCGGPPTIDKMTGAEGRSGQNVYADTSPGDLLPIGVRQIVAFGELDIIVSASFGRAFATAAAASGDRVEMLDLPGAGHFDLIDPRSAGWQQVRQKIFMLLQ
jgi:acetyl esterase/lipase